MIASSPRYRKSKGIDWILMSLFFSLLFIGWMMLYSTVYNEAEPLAFINPRTQIGSQTIWVVICMFAFVICMVIDWKFWNTFAYPIYVVTILSLIAVLIFGKEINGAKSWFSIGGSTLQPSEFAKFGTALAVSSFTAYYKSNIESTKTFLTVLALVILPIILVILQPDPGSAIVFLSIFILLYRLGLSGLYYILGIGSLAIFILSLLYGPMIVSLNAIIGGVLILILSYKKASRNTVLTIGGILLMTYILYHINPLFGLGLASFSLIVYLTLYIRERKLRLSSLVGGAVLLSVLLAQGTSFAFNNLLKEHHKTRINVWLKPSEVNPEKMYNLIQSKLAIGSGGFQGKGFLQGNMTKLNYVPAQTTDFIFSTVGEEQGFIGSISVILIFTILIIRITVIAERARSPFIRNYAYCVAGFFFVHFFINIGMSMGLMPVVGIPLPFLSKGGSSLLGFTILIATLLKMDLDR